MRSKYSSLNEFNFFLGTDVFTFFFVAVLKLSKNPICVYQVETIGLSLFVEEYIKPTNGLMKN